MVGRNLTIAAVCAAVTAALAAPAIAAPDDSRLVEPAQSKPVAVNAASIPIAGARPAAAGGVQLKKVCGIGQDAQELITRAGKRSTCARARHLMRDWREAGNPRHFRGFKCGDVAGANVDFAKGKRWFASWQCHNKSVTYRIWTQY